MLVTQDKYLDMPVMSLQTGSELAKIARPIINPSNLSIVAFELQGPLLDTGPVLLRIEDIREMGPIGAIVDSVDELLAVDDVIKLKEIYDIQFELLGKPVIDQRKSKIGTIIGYSIDSSSLVIQQLRVRRPLLKSFNDSELLIHRSKVTKTTDRLIVIKSETAASKKKQLTSRTDIISFENPFRKNTEPSTEATSPH